MQSQLNLALLENTVREMASKVGVNEAKIEQILAETEIAKQQPLLEAQKMGVTLRQDMERMAADLQKQRVEAATRDKISTDKNRKDMFVAQVQSMTKRVDAAGREREKLAELANKVTVAKLKPKPKPAAKKK